jgi:hypothetical protein
VPLGRLLQKSGALAPGVLEAALAAQRHTFLPLGRILRDEHGLSCEALVAGLRLQTHLPRVYLRFFPAEEATVRLLDRRFCAEREVIAFERLGELLCVAFSNPPVARLVLQVRLETGLEVAAFQAPWEDIERKLRLYD